MPKITRNNRKKRKTKNEMDELKCLCNIKFGLTRIFRRKFLNYERNNKKFKNELLFD